MTLVLRASMEGNRRQQGSVRQEEEENPICDCGLRAPLKCWMMEANIGRRFWACRMSDDEGMEDSCGFFRWKDGPMPDHLKKKLIELSQDKDMYKWRWCMALKERDDALCELTDVDYYIKETGTELVDRSKEVQILSERMRLCEELEERFREQKLWILCTIAIGMFNLYC